jgi:hypothetical protein
VSKRVHLPASSEASLRGSQNTSDSSEVSALGLGHKSTHNDIAASSEP